MNLKERVEEVIETHIRPAIASHDGMIDLVDIKEGTVYVRLVGACSHCPSSSFTLYNGVLEILQQHFPTEVTDLEQVH